MEDGKLYPSLQDARMPQDPGHHQVPPPGPPQGGVVQQQVIITQSFGAESTTALCPNCQASVTTSTSTEASAMAWIACLLLCCFGCWPCACVPFCVCQKTTHKCPSCNTHLGESN